MRDRPSKIQFFFKIQNFPLHTASNSATRRSLSEMLSSNSCSCSSSFCWSSTTGNRESKRKRIQVNEPIPNGTPPCMISFLTLLKCFLGDLKLCPFTNGKPPSHTKIWATNAKKQWSYFCNTPVLLKWTWHKIGTRNTSCLAANRLLEMCHL